MEITWALKDDTAADSALAVQCALLHDTIEDTAATYEIVHSEFGEAVAKYPCESLFTFPVHTEAHHKR